MMQEMPKSAHDRLIDSLLSSLRDIELDDEKHNEKDDTTEVSSEEFEKKKELIRRKIDAMNADQFYVLSKRKTITFKRNTFQWWNPEGRGYTELLNEAGVFDKEEIKEIVKPDSRAYCFTTNVAIPVEVAEDIFGLNVIPFNEDNKDLLEDNRSNLIGDLNWDMPRFALA